MHERVTWPYWVQSLEHKIQDVWKIRNSHWTYIHYNLAQKCHKLHKLDREKFKQLESLNLHLILPNFILLFQLIGFKYNNLVNWCWMILLRMTIMSAQQRLVIRLHPCEKRSHQQQMNQRVADPPTSLEHCLFNGCRAICMFCDMLDVNWYIRRSRKSHDGGYWCTGDYLVLGHLQLSWWRWLGSASRMYSVSVWKDGPASKKENDIARGIR